MLKVFLVEDEIVMREGIKKNIDWQAEGFEFVGEASDGELAYPLIQKTRPDILITDIKMPFMDGLELSRLVKSEMPEISIIILSGYNEFDYAKEAISIGITDYLVKPMTSAQLVAAIHGVEKKIKEQRAKEAKKNDGSLMRQQELLARQSLFRKMVSGTTTSTELLKEGRACGMDLAASCYNIFLLQLFSGMDTQEDSIKIERIKQALEGLQQSYADVLMIVQGKEEYAFLFKATDTVHMKELAEEYLSKLKQLISEAEQTEYYGVFGRPVERLSDLKKCYDEVGQKFLDRYQKQRNQFEICTGKVSYQDQIDEIPLDFEHLNVSQTDRRALEQFISTGAKSEIDEFLKNYFEKIGTNNIQSLLFRQYMTMDMHIIISAFMQEISCDKQEFTKQFCDEKKMLNAIASLEETINYLKQMLEYAIEMRENASGNKYTHILKQAQSYIESNYANEEISLNMVAAEVGLSPNHFSTIFGQELGETFIEYLTRIRMEEAKKLLRTTQMKTTDIAFAVGYHDAHYFSNLFKKTQNCTPREYRNRE